MYEHFSGAFSWSRLEEDQPVLSRFGRHPATDPGAMSETVKETAAMFGADLVGVCELDRRWVYARDMDGRVVEISPSFTHAVVMAVAMDPAAIAESPGYLAASATGVGYSRMAFVIACLAEFIRNLGYAAIPMGNDTALSIPLAIDAGLGQLGRNGLLITPQFGPRVRISKVFTNLPLVPDEPIDIGVEAMCRVCNKCASSCPGRAISHPDPLFAPGCPTPASAGRQPRWPAIARCAGRPFPCGTRPRPTSPPAR